MAPPMHLRAAAESTPSGVPPMPMSTSTPDSGQEVAIAPATSPSLMRRIRAPVARICSISSACLGRSSTITVRSFTDSSLARAIAARFWAGRRRDVDHLRRLGPDDDLLHVDERPRVEHAPALGHGDDGDGPRAAVGGERGAVDGVDGDVSQRRCAVSDALAVEEHGSLVLLPLADHDDAVHRDALQARSAWRRRPPGPPLPCPRGPSSAPTRAPRPPSRGPAPWRGSGRAAGAGRSRLPTIAGDR